MVNRSDAQLLNDYVRSGDEDAFGALVARHTDFVFSSALRQVNSPDVAGELSQSVFCDLVRKSQTLTGTLPRNGSLVGWLHRATRYAALSHLRATRRRLTNERQAMQELLEIPDSAPEWERIHPVLDEALDSLGDQDREALLLRYFKNQSFRSVGVALGVSDDAAQKRVSRAVDRLRVFIGNRGVTIGAQGLVTALATNAVQAAPAGLALTISTSAAFAGSALATSASAMSIKTIAMTTLQKTLVTSTLIGAVGTGIYQAREASQLREQIQTGRQAHALLTERADDLQGKLEQAESREARLRSDLADDDESKLELLKLRGDVGQLRQQAAINEAANEQLRQENRRLREAQATAANAEPEAAPTQFARQSWAYSGYETPENTMQTVFWSQLKGDIKAYVNGLTPDAQGELISAIERKPGFVASAMASMSKIKGFTILKSVPLADDQTLVRLSYEMEDGTEKFITSTLQLIDGEWKVKSGGSE